MAPLIAIPTTAGTGSEASRGAGIHADAASRGSGLNGYHIVPKVAICDPELTLTLPARLTAGTGMDALSHCVEGYLATPLNPPTDAIALDGVTRVFGHIERAVSHGDDRDARWQLMMAALEGGMSLGKGLGAGHALANTFGDRGFHHGTLVTLALPTVLRLLERHVPEKIAALAAAMGARERRRCDRDDERAGGVCPRICARLAIPRAISTRWRRTRRRAGSTRAAPIARMSRNTRR